MIHFLSTFLKSNKAPLDALENIVQSVLETVKNQIDYQFDGDIIFHGNKQRVIPNYSIGGYCPDPWTITIYIDSEKFDIQDQDCVDLLRYILTHELMHSLYYTQHGMPLTLKDEIVFEGIADYCASQIVGNKQYLWTQALSKDDHAHYWSLLKNDFDQKDQYFKWFFGTQDIPMWTGYKIGYQLLQDYTQNNQNLSVSVLARLKADVILL
jgi:uncharacterized protein YjaZ